LYRQLGFLFGSPSRITPTGPVMDGHDDVVFQLNVWADVICFIASAAELIVGNRRFLVGHSTYKGGTYGPRSAVVVDRHPHSDHPSCLVARRAALTHADAAVTRHKLDYLPEGEGGRAKRGRLGDSKSRQFRGADPSPHPTVSFRSARSLRFASAFLAPRTAAKGRLCPPEGSYYGVPHSVDLPHDERVVADRRSELCAPSGFEMDRKWLICYRLRWWGIVQRQNSGL
jgi:hypothetical protein